MPLAYVLTVALVFNSEEIPAILQKLMEADWQQFIELVKKNRIACYAQQKLKPYGSLLPPAILKALEALVAEVKKHALAQLVELSKVIDQLHATDVAFIPLKGPLLAQQLYGDIAYKSSSDLDFIVKYEDMPKVTELLGRLGYYPKNAVLYSKPAPALQKDVLFVKKGGGTPLEIHWRLSKLPYLWPGFNYQKLKAYVQNSVFAGREIQQFRLPFLVVYLSYHAATHNFCGLRWLVDLKQVLVLARAAFHEEDWREVVKIARLAKVVPWLWMGLQLVFKQEVEQYRYYFKESEIKRLSYARLLAYSHARQRHVLHGERFPLGLAVWYKCSSVRGLRGLGQIFWASFLEFRDRRRKKKYGKKIQILSQHKNQ